MKQMSQKGKLNAHPGHECSSWETKLELFCSSLRYDVHILVCECDSWLTECQQKGQLCHDKQSNLEPVSNLDFVIVPTKQLEAVAKLYWLGFDLSHIALPIHSYRMQLFAWRYFAISFFLFLSWLKSFSSSCQSSGYVYLKKKNKHLQSSGKEVTIYKEGRKKEWALSATCLVLPYIYYLLLCVIACSALTSIYLLLHLEHQ